jgi:hypothetical protein
MGAEVVYPDANTCSELLARGHTKEIGNSNFREMSPI